MTSSSAVLLGQKIGMMNGRILPMPVSTPPGTMISGGS
jgi:hypothetical protein